MSRFKAFLFDLNGTMINDMPYHVRAWHAILNNLGADISMERVKEECYGKNGELLERVFPGRFTGKEKDVMSYEKEKKYQQEFRPYLQLIDGLHDLLEAASENRIKMGIGSAAIMFNVDFVLDGLNIRHFFSSLVSADDVEHSKPDPETFLKCAAALGVAPGECLVFEDAPKGVEAAMNAGMQAVVLTTMHTVEDFAAYPNVICFVKDFRDARVGELVGMGIG